MVNLASSREFFGSAIDFFFPPLCLGCGEYTDEASAICSVCVKRISPFKQPFCLNCMAFYSGECQCLTCNEKTVSLYSFAAYASPIKDIIIQYKFKGITSPAEYFAELLVNQFKSGLSSFDVDVLIPIPLHRSREKVRGYNQATLFAQALSVYLGVEVDDEIIFRSKKRKPQARLPVSKRSSNISTVFEVDEYSEAKKNCILVDDVVTTGSTVLEAKSRLEEKGYFVQAVVSIAHAL